MGGRAGGCPGRRHCCPPPVPRSGTGHMQEVVELLNSWPRACLPSGDVSIGIKCAPGVVGPAEADIVFDIIKNDNDTFTVKYTPPGAGRYTIMVLFANQVPCAWVLVINPNLTPLPHPNQQLERLSFGDNSAALD